LQQERSLGAVVTGDGVTFTVASGTAKSIELCLFDELGDRQVERLALERRDGGLFSIDVPGLAAGARYGLRADGEYDPARGLWFDPDKLLVDPYALAIDRPYAPDPRLSARRGEGGDTAPLVPKAIAAALPEPLPHLPPLFRPGGLIYELQVKAFTRRHPGLPEEKRGTIGALAHPLMVDYLTSLKISAVELMPVAAWIDERHLRSLGLRNGWGYNPVTFMALDPRLAPGGLAELRRTVAALRKAGISVILDVVFNHTGEGDEGGPTLSLRGLDNLSYYRHFPDDPGRLVNDTGTGNTLACDNPLVEALVLETLRHFVCYAGVDGFRFDLAPVLGRDAAGYRRNAPLLEAIAGDPLLKDRVLIAEPWDVGAGGYQLGNFPPPFLEWNDRYRDDLRRFWRGDGGLTGALATRLAGSSDIFGPDGAKATRTVNFLAAHDGMTLFDLTAFEKKHNEANGEGNRDGHGENFSWNNGEEGRTDDAAIRAKRRTDVAALLSTLFFSRGTIMLTAGDEFGRSQRGNNNAYAQDNELTWLDWRGADIGLFDYTCNLASLRAKFAEIAGPAFLTGHPAEEGAPPDVAWLTEDGNPMEGEEWSRPERRALAMVLAHEKRRLAILFNGHDHPRAFRLAAREGCSWHVATASELPPGSDTVVGMMAVPERSVVLLVERPADARAGEPADRKSE
jgi:glycogen operon protein